MAVEEIKSKIFYIKGNSKIELAYSKNRESAKVENGRCVYLVRLELALEGHPEIKENKFFLDIRTTKDGLFYSKGLGGSRKGISGTEKTFEQLIEKAQFPNNRNNESMHGIDDKSINDILNKYHYDCNFRIYTEFHGYWDAFGAHFDEFQTYKPIIIQAIEEVKPFL